MNAPTDTTPGARITRAIRALARHNRPALIPFITAGFPTRDDFANLLHALAPHAAAIEIGIPFTDPMADGVTIQRTSRIALDNGVTLPWIIEEIRRLRSQSPPLDVPLILMGYLNPFLAFGFDRLADACASARIDALIIPDLPLEESGPIRASLHARAVGLVQLVSPVTPADRAARIARSSDGFLYAVTTTGITGNAVSLDDCAPYLDRLREANPEVPVCAGFGIRTSHDVRALAPHVDGVIIGSALMQELEAGRNPADLLRSLAG